MSKKLVDSLKCIEEQGLAIARKRASGSASAASGMSRTVSKGVAFETTAFFARMTWASTPQSEAGGNEVSKTLAGHQKGLRVHL